jgi:hypothetical protein
MIKFVNDDMGYLKWLHANPQGFVLNSYKNPSRNYLVVHRATCATISTASRSNWTTTDYIKICSTDLRELKDWAVSGVRGPLKPCSFCGAPRSLAQSE